MNEQFASRVYDLADEALIAAGEYELARKPLGDPAPRFETARQNFEMGMRYAETSKYKAASRRAHRAIFVDDIVRLITVLDKAGERRAAKKFQSKALKLCNHKAVHAAIKSAARDRSKRNAAT